LAPYLENVKKAGAGNGQEVKKGTVGKSQAGGNEKEER